MRKLMIIFMAVMSLSTIGCASRMTDALLNMQFGYYKATSGAPIVESAACFSVGEISDSTGFADSDQDAFGIKELMKLSLQSKLEESNPTDKDSPQYVVNVDIKEYNPRKKAFAIFLGSPLAASIMVTATILDQEGNELANIGATGSELMDPIVETETEFDRAAIHIVDAIRDTENKKELPDQESQNK